MMDDFLDRLEKHMKVDAAKEQVLVDYRNIYKTYGIIVRVKTK